MFECPVIYYEQNLIFDNMRSCWGVFKLAGFDYENRSEESKLDILNKLTRVISTITSEAKILIIPAVLDLENHYGSLIRTLDDQNELFHYTVNHAQLTKKYLQDVVEESGANSNDYDVYIIVKLVMEDEADVSLKLKEYFEFFFRDPVNAFDTFMHTSTKDIMESKITHFKKLAYRFLFEQDKRITMREATTTEIQFLLKRSTHKGIERDIHLNLATQIVEQDGRRRKIISDWTPYAERSMTQNENDVIVRPYLRDVVNLFQGEISTKDKRMITVEHNNGAVSYQTYLVITHTPDVLDFPDNEWIYLLQNLNVQAEICIHMVNIEHREALRKLDFKKREINSQYENIVNANAEVPDDLLLSHDEVNELESELKASRSPMTKACVSICLFGTNPEEVERKASFIKDTYKDMNFNIEQPISDQLKLFIQHIPGAGFYTRDLSMMLPPQTLAGGVIGVNNQLGDTVGPYIGTTGRLNKPVFLDMGLACRINKSAAATFFGNLGFGKSFNANLLTCLNVFYGGYALIFDPKGERSEWPERLTMLDGLINMVTLDSSMENKGKLDPFLVYADDFDSASELALNVLTEMYGLKPKDKEFIVLMEAIGEMEHIKNPCMSKLCDILEKSRDVTFKEHTDTLAKRIRATQRIGMSKLIFGTGKEEAISLDKRINIFQIQNLKLPSPETPRDGYTMEESISVVIMMILGNFAKKFALTKRDVFSTILFDESWALGKTAEGVKLYDFLSRMGRSLYTGCIFNGHSVLDIPTEGIKNTITYKFCFHSDNQDEIERMLDYMSMEKTAENIELIKGLENRECVFQDLYGRVGKLKFDAVFQDIIEAFSTTPKGHVPKEPEEAYGEKVNDISDTGSEDIAGKNVPDAESNDDSGDIIVFTDLTAVKSNSLFEREIV